MTMITPCGAARGSTLKVAWERALAGDPSTSEEFAGEFADLLLVLVEFGLEGGERLVGVGGGVELLLELRAGLGEAGVVGAQGLEVLAQVLEPDRVEDVIGREAPGTLRLRPGGVLFALHGLQRLGVGTLGSAAGFPNDPTKIGLIRYYTDTGIGAGFGGLALAIRLQSAGIATTIVEARDKAVVVINGQGPAPKAANPSLFAGEKAPPSNGPLGATIPAVVDAAALALDPLRGLGRLHHLLLAGAGVLLHAFFRPAPGLRLVVPSPSSSLSPHGTTTLVVLATILMFPRADLRAWSQLGSRRRDHAFAGLATLAAFLLTGGNSIRQVPESLTWLGQGRTAAPHLPDAGGIGVAAANLLGDDCGR